MLRRPLRPPREPEPRPSGSADQHPEDRVGPPAHRHPWDGVEYVIEGEVEFLVGEEPWRRVGPGGVQVLPAGIAHSVRVPAGAARVLMVTFGSPYAPFARELAALGRDGAAVTGADIVAVAHRHGPALASEPQTDRRPEQRRGPLPESPAPDGPALESPAPSSTSRSQPRRRGLPEEA